MIIDICLILIVVFEAWRIYLKHKEYRFAKERAKSDNLFAEQVNVLTKRCGELVSNVEAWQRTASIYKQERDAFEKELQELRTTKVHNDIN